MSHVHVKINFSFGIDSWNRCLSVYKRLQIRALHTSYRVVFRLIEMYLEDYIILHRQAIAPRSHN
jgi:hypothetical protein